MRIALLIVLLVSSFSEGHSQGTKKIVPQKQIAFTEVKTPEDFFLTPYEKGNYTQTATYAETFEWYQKIQKAFPQRTSLFEIGTTDIGLPMYCFKIGKMPLVETQKKGQVTVGEAKNKFNKSNVKVLINNNIHPGEPEGTDACMLLVRDMLVDGHRFRRIFENLDVYIILQFNVDGTLNRNSTSRANQNGPDEYGFRGNAKNLDLNRDFIKLDSRNTQTLVSFMTKEKFDYFVDNHTSNGADYQYTLTYFHTRIEKLPSHLVKTTLMVDTLLKQSLVNAGWPTSPYVNTLQEVPDSGLVGFYESPRFATGWASLKHTIGFTVETHMLKPFHTRVDATRDFLESFLNCVSSAKVIDQKKKDLTGFRLNQNSNFTKYNHFKLDTKSYELMDFLGYEFSYKPSGISGLPRLYYDRNKPKTIRLKYYNHYVPTDSVVLPKAYVVPFAYKEVIERLEINGVKFTSFRADTSLFCNVSYIEDYKTVKDPYEGHYLHSQVKTRDTMMKINVYAGDKLVFVNPENSDFLSATLEPKSPDSYFCWNFFDGILQQKEGYSAYVFEDKAVEILSKNRELKVALMNKQQQDANFAKDAAAQLDYVYKHSEYYEKSHKRYPVYRIVK